ncbi:MAG: MFS transporter [Actinobacteria bacterium]|nr:MFS transporter [Actinomycetota bacterium]
MAGIINSAGNFVYPFLALFLTLKLGYNENNAGLVLTIIIAAEGLGRLVGGKLTDWVGRKIIIIVLSLLGSVCYLVIVFLGISPFVVYLIVLAGFLKTGAMPAMNALVIDVTTKKNRNDAFSLIYLGQNLGFAIGPLIAGFLFVNHLMLIFIVDAITTILALIPIMILLKEPSKSIEGFNVIGGQVNEESERSEAGNTVRVFFKKPVLVGYAFISIILSFVYAQSTFGLPLYLNQIFNQDGPKIYGSLMAVNAIIVIALTLILISIFKKYSPLLNISIAGILFAVGFGLLFYSKLYFLFIISTMIWTFGEIINSVSSNVLIANYSPANHRGRFNAIIFFISGAGFAISPWLMGLYIRHFGLANTWPFIFAISIFASLLILFLLLYEKLKNR